MKKYFPVGKVKILELSPMDFEEFIREVLGKIIIDIIKKSYIENEPMVDSIHEKLLSLYRIYLCIGGMPEAISNCIKNK